MTIHVNIAEAKARLSELLTAALRGEEVIVSRAGKPQARIQPLEEARAEERERIAAKRKAAIGMFAKEFEGYDLSIDALKQDRGDPDERFQRKFGSPS
jgi:prevent-host-death family protein